MSSIKYTGYVLLLAIIVFNNISAEPNLKSDAINMENFGLDDDYDYFVRPGKLARHRRRIAFGLPNILVLVERRSTPSPKE
jgi:hypothetical protein